MDDWVCGKFDSPDDRILRSLDGAEVVRYGKDWVVGAVGTIIHGGVGVVVQGPIKLE